jgi:hypothetical protein
LNVFAHHVKHVFAKFGDAVRLVARVDDSWAFARWVWVWLVLLTLRLEPPLEIIEERIFVNYFGLSLNFAFVVVKH